MADKEITAQIDKLRKTRPARAIDMLWASAGETGMVSTVVLADVLGFLRDDLKDEARLLENAKIKGGVTIMKDRLAVASWLELFCAQLAREPQTYPGTPPLPAPERTEPVTTHDALNALVDDAKSKGLGELVAGDKRCAAQDTDHGRHTWIGPRDPQTGSSRWNCRGGDADQSMIEDPYVISAQASAHTTSVADYLSGASDDIPGAREHYERLSDGSITITDAAAYIGDALEPAQQDAHTTVDQELAHVIADRIAIDDPFAPIPRPVWGAAVVPPGGRAWTSSDLLVPIEPQFVPEHLSFSQATTVTDCGAKWRMQRVAGLPQVPQWANVGGKAFHAAVEAYERDGEADWQIMLETQITSTELDSGMARESFRASAGGKEGYDWWRVEGAAMLQRYVDWRTCDGAGNELLQGPTARPMLEWETTYNVDGVPFKTILDSVWTNTHHDLAIIRDWKTGAGTPDNRQLCTQAWGLRMAGWKSNVLVQFFDARKGTFTEPFDPFGDTQGMSWDDVRYFVLSADAQRRLPILPARPSDWCGGCSVAYACPIMSQRKAKR